MGGCFGGPPWRKPMKNLKMIVPFLLVLLMAAIPSHAQTTTTTTTLSAAITDAGATTVYLTSGTNVEANGFIYVDQELMPVVGALNGSTTVWRVRRTSAGIGGTHASGAKVYVASAGAMARNVFRNAAPSGTCTATAEAYLPVVHVPSGVKFNCVSSTWVPFQENTQQFTTNVRVVDQTDRTKQVAFSASGITTATTRTVTFPDASITVSGATATDCGTSAGACSTTTTSATLKIVSGTATSTSASPSTVAITGMPAFTSTATYKCFASNATTAANVFSVLTAGYVSTTAVTFTGPNTLTDVIRWTCIGY